MEEKFRNSIPYGPLGVIALEGCTQMGKKVDEFLVNWRHDGKRPQEIGRVFEGYVKDS